MNSRTNDRRTARAHLRRERHYEVGYGKPPPATRFKPGHSGNPGGRPKSSGKIARPSLNEERLKSIILDEAYRTISVNEATGPITISMAQAVIRSLAVNAAKGNPRAQRQFTQLLSAIEQDNKHLHDQWLETAINYKVEWERELERRKRLGITAPGPVPHPNDIMIDMQTGSIRILGPMTKEEKVIWDRLKQANEPETADLKEALNRDPNKPVDRVGVFQAIPDTAGTITEIRRIIVSPKDRPVEATGLTDEELTAIARGSE